jgi:hypothetical protein
MNKSYERALEQARETIRQKNIADFVEEEIYYLIGVLFYQAKDKFGFDNKRVSPEDYAKIQKIQHELISSLTKIIA